MLKRFFPAVGSGAPTGRLPSVVGDDVRADDFGAVLVGLCMCGRASLTAANAPPPISNTTATRAGMTTPGRQPHRFGVGIA